MEHKNNRFLKKRGLIKPSLEFKTHKRKFNKYLKKYGLKWSFDISPIQFGNGYVGDKSMLATYCFFYRAFIDREICKALDRGSLPVHLFLTYKDLKYGDALERENKNVYESEFKFPFGTVKIVSGKLTEEEKKQRKTFEKYVEVQRERFSNCKFVVLEQRPNDDMVGKRQSKFHGPIVPMGSLWIGPRYDTSGMSEIFEKYSEKQYDNYKEDKLNDNN